MFRLKRAAQAAALLLVAACTGDAGTLVGPSEGPSSIISDAAHAGAVPGFYFLPPLVPQPSYSGTFDAGLSPRVEICQMAGAVCGPTIATFTKTSGTGGELVKVDAASQSYQVNWHSKDFNLDPAKTYRIQVFVGTFLLGFADVDVVSSGNELKNVNTQQYIALKDGRTLPLKFRIETGIVGQVVVSPPADTVNVGGTSQFTATLIDLHGNPVAGPAVTWTSSDPAVATIDASGLATGVAPGTVTITASVGYASGTATLTVEQPNQPPVAAADTFQAIGNVTVPVSSPGVLANDTDPDADALSVTAGSYPTAAGGTVVLNADGSFAYLSAAGFTGTDSFTYEISDGIATSSATVTVQVPTRVWYVSAAASGDGRDASPFGTLAEAEGASAAGETIFLLAGSYATGITLKNDQSLTGQGVAADITASLNGETVVLLAAGGTPSVGGTIQLAQDNTVQGLNVAAPSGAGIAGSGFGTFTAALVNVSAQGGPALDLASGNVAASFGTVSSSNSAGPGLDLSGLTGTLTATGGSITGAAGAGVLIVGGSGTIDYAGDISGSGAGAAQVSGRTGGSVTLSGAIVDGGSGIVVQNNTGGSIAFTGPSKTLDTGTGNGVTLANNGGASVTFGGGGLDITTTTGTGFSAAGGGTVTVTGAGNDITAAGGIALSVVNTTIGASGLTFHSISADGGAVGIVAENTGALNGFQVTGDGATAGTGGTLRNLTHDGVRLRDTRNIILRYMVIEDVGASAGSSCTRVSAADCSAGVDAVDAQNVVLDHVAIDDAGQAGIAGHQVSGFTFTDGSVTDAGNGDEEFGILFSNLSGAARIEDVVIDRPEEGAIRLYNNAGSLDLTVLRTTMSNNDAVSGFGEDGFSLELEGSATADVLVDDSDFTLLRRDGVDAIVKGVGGAALDLTVRNSTFSQNAGFGGVIVVSQNTATANTTISGNLFENTVSTAITLTSIQNSTFDATVVNNTIRHPAPPAAQVGSGIRLSQEEESDMTALVQGNQTSGTGVDGLRAFSRLGSSPAANGISGTLHLTALNNTVATPLTLSFGIDIAAQNTENEVCLVLSGNQANGNTVAGIRVRQQQASVFQVEGLALGAQTAATMAAFVNANNTSTPAATATAVTSFTGVAAGTCRTPAATTLP